MDNALIVSIILNIVLAILALYLSHKRTSLSSLLDKAISKLNDIIKLIETFEKSYKDGYISPSEAKQLIEQVKKIIEDP